MAETVPPLTETDLEEDLMNDAFSAYFYVGEETDEGWDNAQAAFGLIAKLRIFLIKDTTQIAKWCGNKRPAGIVFGWEDDVYCYLNKAEAADFKTVINKITEARAK